jgi:hypothetical protein
MNKRQLQQTQHSASDGRENLKIEISTTTKKIEIRRR